MFGRFARRLAPGEDKTHLATTLGRKICQDNILVDFLPVNLMFEEVLAARSSGKMIGYLKKLNPTRVLILDDFGLRQYTHEEATVLIELIEARARKGPVIITSQVDPKGWFKLFEDAVIAEATVDRMINPSQRVVLKVGSCQKKTKSAYQWKIACRKYVAPRWVNSPNRVGR